MILKTFKLSKNILICLLYILLMLTTVSYQTKDEPASKSLSNIDKNNNPNEDVQDNTDIISSNANNPTENTETDNNGNLNINSGVLQGIFQRMREASNNPAQKKSNDDEVNPEENDIPKINNIEQEQPVPNKEDLFIEDNPLYQMKLGLNSEPENEQNTDDEKTKKKKRKKKTKKNQKQLETEDNEAESKVSGVDNIENQQSENSINYMELNSNPELTTAMDVDLEEANDQTTHGEVELEEANDQNTDGKKKKRGKRKENKQKQETDKNIIENILTQDNMEINPMDIPVSPLENVEIVKIKKNNKDTENKRKYKKKSKIQK